MLNFKNTSIFFSGLLLVLLLCNLKLAVPGLYYWILVIAYSLLLFYGSYRVDSGFYIKVICSAKTDQKEIALSFDDGPALEFTSEILSVLNENQVPAAFFCIGNRIRGNEQLLRQIQDAGHVIGNHSFSHHPAFDLFSSRAMSADLLRTDQEILRVLGVAPRMFRPPYGVTNPPLKKAILRGNYIPVGWSIRSLDTVIKDEKKLLGKVTRLLAPGAVLLFHDTSKATVAILPALIREAKLRGYRFVRLDKLLKLDPYA